MVKTSGFKKVLAILLSVLLTAAMAAPAVSAEGETVFTKLSLYTSSLNEGDVWYNSRALASATGTDVYRTQSTFYLSEDGNVLKIEYTLNDEPVTELRYKDTDAAYFDYLRVMPAFGPALPTSPDGLEDGAYWYDKDGLISAVSASMPESLMYMYTTAVFYLSVDGTILRQTYDTPYGFSSNSDELVVENPGTLCRFLRQVGVDPNAGFVLLPTSEEGLEEGDYWFDAASLAALFGAEDEKTMILNGSYYLSEDGNTLRMVLFGSAFDYDKTDNDGALFFSYLRQAGIDPNAGFTLLPSSDTGLADGDYWFDTAGLAAATGSEDILLSQFYLSEDGSTIRMIMNGYPYDYAAGSSEMANLLFGYLRQVGVDPNAGFRLLPTSDEGLAAGDYWYDAAGLAAAEGEADLLSAQYYLSEDGGTLRVQFDGYLIDLVAGSSDTADRVFSFLRQVSAGESKDVLWAGYASALDGISLDAGEKPTAADGMIYVIAKTGACKIQIRDAAHMRTWTFNDAIGTTLDRHTAVQDIIPVTFEGTECDLWIIRRELSADDYVAIAKYQPSEPINRIADERGAAFCVDADPVYDTAVYSVTIGGIDDSLGYIVFDGKTSQTITVVTGVDVNKVQFVSKTNGATFTYSKAVAKSVVEGELDGKPVLIWTISRFFAKDTYDFTVNTRSALGLADSGRSLTFEVAAAPIPENEAA